MSTLTIDKIEVTVPDETTILEAAEQAEIYIPHLCFHPESPPVEQLNQPCAHFTDSAMKLKKTTDFIHAGYDLALKY